MAMHALKLCMRFSLLNQVVISFNKYLLHLFVYISLACELNLRKTSCLKFIQAKFSMRNLLLVEAFLIRLIARYSTPSRRIANSSLGFGFHKEILYLHYKFVIFVSKK